VAQFVHRQRVRYHETDAQHHVYNSHYLEYIDVAFTEFVRNLGWNYLDLVHDGCDPSLVHVELDFVGPARFDEEIVLAVRAVKVGRTSFTLRYDGAVADRPVIAATVVYVNYDTDTSRSRPLPDRFRERLSALIG
jgi:acyl-CoA thioester hydrolase